MSEDRKAKYESGIIDIVRKHMTNYEQRTKEIFKDYLRELQNDQIERLTLHELLEEIDRLQCILSPEELEHDRLLRADAMKIFDLNRKLEEAMNERSS